MVITKKSLYIAIGVFVGIVFLPFIILILCWMVIIGLLMGAVPNG